MRDSRTLPCPDCTRCCQLWIGAPGGNRTCDSAGSMGRFETSVEKAKWVRNGSVIGGETREIDRYRRDAKLQVNGTLTSSLLVVKPGQSVLKTATRARGLWVRSQSSSLYLGFCGAGWEPGVPNPPQASWDRLSARCAACSSLVTASCVRLLALEAVLPELQGLGVLRHRPDHVVRGSFRKLCLNLKGELNLRVRLAGQVLHHGVSDLRHVAA